MHTPIGEIWNDDVVYCQHDGEIRVGSVVRFLYRDNDYCAEISAFEALDGRGVDWDIRRRFRYFVRCHAIRANLPWSKLDGHRVRVILPAAFQVP